MLSSEKTREEIVGNGTLDNSGNGYPVGFKVLADTDLKVYVDGTLRKLSNPAEYTVANAGTNTNATVSFLGSAFGTPATQLSDQKSIVFVRDAAFTQPSNYQNNDIFDAETLENSLDRATMLAQQSKGSIDRAIKFSDTATGIDSDVTEITAAANLRANKLISFDANGDIQVTQEIGTFKGDWAGQTVYVQRDLVKQNSDSDASTKDNIYICTKEHTSTGTYLTENDLTNTVTDKWTLVLDVASASGGLVEAVAWSTKTDGQVIGSTTTDYSSKAYAIGGTGLDTSSGSAKDWASKASGNVGNTSLKSSKQYAEAASLDAGTANTKASEANTDAGLASDHKSDAGKYAVHPHNQTFTLSSTNGGTSGLKSALHYATEAQNALDTFQGQYHGSLTSAPSSNVDTGDLYYQSTGDVGLKIYNGSSWESLETEVGGNVITSTTGNNLNLVTPSNSNKVVINSGSNSIQLPNVRASQDNYVLAMSNTSTGETSWQVTQTAPTITGITSGQLNSYYDADGTTVSNDKGGTLVIAGTDFGTNIGDITAVRICASDGSSQISATTLGSLSDTSITATWNGTESGYSSFSGVYYVEAVKSGMTSNRFNSTKSFSADPTISSVTGTGGEGDNVTVTSSNLGSYGGAIAGGGQDSNTKLLLNFDRTGGTDIEDSSNTSGDGHQVTANGNATIKASPFGDGKSAMFFDGTNDYLHIAQSSATNADFNFGTSTDYTIEGWYKATTRASGYAGILGTYSAQTAGYSLGLVHHNYTTDGAIQFSLCLTTNNFTNALLCGGSVSARFEEWIHFALVRSGSTTSMYINGKLADSTTTSINMASSSGLRIGSNGTDNASDVMNGYLDEIRIVKGTAVYTGNFDVPISRLSVTQSNQGTNIADIASGATKLLIHSNLNVNDSSEFNIPITKVNNTTVTTVNKKDDARPSSFVFDGTDDYILAHDTDTAFGTGPFTVECWYRSGGTSNQQVILDTRNANPEDGVYLYIASNQLKVYDDDHSPPTINGSVTLSQDTWYHFAMVRETNNGDVKTYVDGVLNSTHTPGHSYTTSYAHIGTDQSDGSYELGAGTSAYLRDFRIVKGTAVYTGAFTRPTGPLTTTGGTYSSTTNVTTSIPSSHTKLLLTGDGAFFGDSSSSNHTISATGSLHSEGHGGIAPAMTWPTSLKSTGSAGAYFDGSGDYLYLPHNSDFDFCLDTSATSYGSIEAWVWQPDIDTNATRTIIQNSHSSNHSTNVWSFHIADGKLQFHVKGAGTFNITSATYDFTAGQWHHVAVTKEVSSSNSAHRTYKIYVDGVLKGTDTSDSFASFNGSLAIGAYYNGSAYQNYMNGYIDGFRFRLGSASEAMYTPTSSNLPNKIYGAMFPANPSVGTITITGATTDSTDIAFTEINNSLPNGLTLNDQGAGNQTATITGELTDVVISDTTTNNIRIQAKANADNNRITEVNESSGVGAVSITKKTGGEPVLFNARRYVGNDLARDINGLGFKPDFVWFKERDSSNYHQLFDSVRGGDKALYSNATNAQNDRSGNANNGQITSFNNDGFSLSTDTQDNGVNQTGQPVIAWAWKAGTSFTPTASNYTNPVGSKNTVGGFSIVKVTAGSSAADASTVTHGLNQKPDFIIGKALSGTYNWDVFHKDLTGGYTSTKRLNLNTDTGEINYYSGGWGVTNTQFNTGGTAWHGANTDVIYYCFHAVSGVSAFGSYTGAGGSARRVYTDSNGDGTGTGGFQPKWVAVKNISNTASWAQWDSFRTSNATDTTVRLPIMLNESAGESSNSSVTGLQWHSNGFSVTENWSASNSSGDTYIYMAFA